MKKCMIVLAMSAISLSAVSVEPTVAASGKRQYMGVNRNLSEKIVENAKIALRDSCRAKPGESVVVLVDKEPQRVQCAQALEAAAVELGLKPMIIDLSVYSGLVHDPSFVHNDQKYPTDKAELESRVLKPAKAAAEAADIVLCLRSPGLTLTYANLFGVPHMDDMCLTGEKRRMEYQYVNMENWNLKSEEVAAIGPRTTWLYEKVLKTKVIRITSPAGMDLSVPVEPGTKIYPILGIVPLYGEVALVPALGPKTEGVIVIDGPTYRGVRPPWETDREPLRFVMKNGRVTEMTGDPEQIARLKKLDETYQPAGFGLDEVGLVSTDVSDNDTYWTRGRFNNGTHAHDTIHIALGKNESRKGVVHSNLHMDMDIRRPTVSLDGLVIIKDGKFVDSVWQK